MEKIQDHILPLFKGNAAKQVLETINHYHIKPYIDEEKNTEYKIRELLKKKSI